MSKNKLILFLFALNCIIIGGCETSIDYYDHLQCSSLKRESPIQFEGVSVGEFNILDENNFIRFEWCVNGQPELVDNYVIKADSLKQNYQLSEFKNSLLIRRKSIYYNQEFGINMILKSGEASDGIKLKYENNYLRFFSSENRLIAHRGFSSLYPENTQIAFEQAAVSGFKYVECDVMLTQDNEWVLIHDESIDRTSNGNGIVKDLSYEDLKQFNFGYPDKFNNKFEQNILRLKEFCEFCELKELKPLIEIKSGATINNLIDLVEIVNSFLSEDEFVITSCNLGILENCRKISPNITLCYNTFNLDFLSNTEKIYSLYPITLGIYVNSIFDEENSLISSNISTLKNNCENNGIIPIIWTVNSKSLRQDLIDTLKCLIITDKL